MVARGTFLLAWGLWAACVPGAEEAPNAWMLAETPVERAPIAPMDDARALAEAKEPQDAPPTPPDRPVRAPLCEGVSEAGLPLAPEGAFIAQGDEVSGLRAACTSVIHATAGARESTLEVRLRAWEGASPAHLSVWRLTNEVMVQPTALHAGDALEVTLDQSGEIFLVLEPSDPHAPSQAYALEVRCLSGCDAEYTRFPVVLLHGLGGAASFGEVAYFFSVADVLEPLGYAIHSPGVSPFGSPQERALEWEAHLDTLVAEGAGRRFNLIAHSLGGLDARYLVGGLGRADLVASVVTIGTPHHGTPVADLSHGLLAEKGAAQLWVDVGASAFAELFGIAGDPGSLNAALAALTSEALIAFNAEVPDDAAVYYASWAGVTCASFDGDCKAACGGETVHPLLAASHFILSLDGSSSDGLVPVASAQWGDYRGEICGDHADEVGLFADAPNPAFDHLAFYRDEVRRLADLGL